MKIKINEEKLEQNIIYNRDFFLHLKPIITSNNTNKKYLYTTLIVDPDAPYPSNPIYKYHLHLMIVNSSDIIINYYPPNPPIDSAPHRYYVLLFTPPKI